jgi:hypothetical protein
MSHPLDGCRAKIERADHNIKRLNILITEFLRLNPYDTVQDVNSDSTEYIYRIIGPPSVALMVLRLQLPIDLVRDFLSGQRLRITCILQLKHVHFIVGLVM